MDVRVRGGTVEPVFSRIMVDLSLLPPLFGSDALPDAIPWATADGQIIVYSAAEETEVTDFLNFYSVIHSVVAESQPDPTLVGKLHGKVRTRSEALAAIASDEVPPTLEDLNERLKAVEVALP